MLVSLGKTFTTILVSTFLILVVGFFLTADAQFAPRLIARFFPPRMHPTAYRTGARDGDAPGPLGPGATVGRSVFWRDLWDRTEGVGC